MDFGIMSVASITVICYLVAQVLKNTSLQRKWLPSLCGCCGGVFGLAAFYIHMADFPADDPITALGMGIVSGLAATGVHQIGKQMRDTDTNL